MGHIAIDKVVALGDRHYVPCNDFICTAPCAVRHSVMLRVGGVVKLPPCCRADSLQCHNDDAGGDRTISELWLPVSCQHVWLLHGGLLPFTAFLFRSRAAVRGATCGTPSCAPRVLLVLSARGTRAWLHGNSAVTDINSHGKRHRHVEVDSPAVATVFGMLAVSSEL